MPCQLQVSECVTYRVHLPILASDDVELAADAVLVVEGARLDVARHHHVERRVGGLVWIIDREVIAAESQVVLGVETAVL